ncbi:FtsX-like permease family protein [Coprothermobacteraceae bacterium]|nr:FtsX-like permease family protein [Coprothermobacteraceae bacterium]
MSLGLLRMHFKEAWRNVLRGGLRSALTVLGIVIGIASVFTILTLSAGTTASINDELGKLGSGVLQIVAREPNVHVTELDMVVLRNASKSVKHVVPYKVVSGQYSYGGYSGRVLVHATDHNYFGAYKIQPYMGRLLSESDVRSQLMVGVIDFTAVEQGAVPPGIIGENLVVNVSGANFSIKVVGAVKSGFSFGGGLGRSPFRVPITLYVPYTSMQKVSGSFAIDTAYVYLSSQSDVENFGRVAVDLLDRLHDTKGAFEASSVLSRLDAVTYVLNIMSIVLALIAGISLVVGGIGVMNIMLVSVTERTREIGIRKAVGARRRDILWQFMMEALILTLSGGVMGIALGWSISSATSKLVNIPMAVTWQNLVLSVSFAFLTGLFFGIYPAYRASLLNPVDALRYE